MNRLVKYTLNMLILILGLGVGATLLTSPVDSDSDGSPSLNWNKAGATITTNQLKLFVWPHSESSPTAEILKGSDYPHSVGVLLLDPRIDALPDDVTTLLDKHLTTTINQQERQQLSMALEALPAVKFAWIGERPKHRARQNEQAMQRHLKDLQSQVTALEEALKSYELETAVLTDQLEKQWSERLLRQTVEDTGTITVMRARALQNLRLRIAKADVEDSETRLEGLSAIENARLDYLSTLNQLLKDQGGDKMLKLLEKNSVFQTPVLQRTDQSNQHGAAQLEGL
ncbi:MAG: hypothetical protein ACPGQS_12615 [Bradymonadia bacterium]